LRRYLPGYASAALKTPLVGSALPARNIATATRPESDPLTAAFRQGGDLLIIVGASDGAAL